ncbi:MAG: prepilin-type N-terminal cleavage/methylation domain-containing protein [Roseateles sp.]|uniref:prepilin-type N-terminal cleavage/methylation domain-containing protein n=1 Tax=Roseateles sp. TaxID=1971397 RepID=UPI004035E064
MSNRLQPSEAHAFRGFTLLEILVVLVLLALAAGLVAPAGARWLDAARQRAWQGDLRAQLLGLPLRAFHEGRALQLDAPSVRALVPEIPADVVIHLSTPLRYGPTGAASPTEIRFGRPGAPPEVWRVMAVTGDVQD